MPMKKEKYPPDWSEISRRIRFERAQGRCEQCNVRHGAIIVREPNTDRYWYVNEVGLIGSGLVRDSDGNTVPYVELPESVIGDDNVKETRVILTTHHIGIDKPDGTPGSPHDKMDCRPENLLCLCARCHLLADGPEHVKSAKVTKAKNKHARIQDAGQQPMFTEVTDGHSN